MTDRYIALTVILEREIREDDAEPVIDAIRMIKGVSKVMPVVSNPETYYAYNKARHEIMENVFEAIEKTKTPKT